MYESGHGPTIRARAVGVGRPAAIALALAIAAAGCGGFIGTTSTSFLGNIRDSDDPNVRYLAYEKLASPGCYDDDTQKAEAARVLAEKLAAGTEPLASRAVICRTLGAIGRPEAAPALREAVADEDPLIRAEACRALGKVGSATDDCTLLARVMAADTQADCRVAAIEALGTLKAGDPRIRTLLVDGMEHADPAIRLASYEAIRSISGTDLGPEAKAWRSTLTATAPTAEPATDPTAPR